MESEVTVIEPYIAVYRCGSNVTFFVVGSNEEVRPLCADPATVSACFMHVLVTAERTDSHRCAGWLVRSRFVAAQVSYCVVDPFAHSHVCNVHAFVVSVECQS